MSRGLDGYVDKAHRSSFLGGARDVLPVLTGIIPFAIIVGLTAVEFGFTPFEITVMSTIVFAGASQLAAIALMADGTPFVVVVLTAILINLRFSLYSVSLAPYVRSLSRLQKVVYSWFLVDVTYALAIPRYEANDAVRTHWYYLGSGATIWIAWVIGTALGAGLGIGIPTWFPAGLILPLVFIALLFPFLRDRPSIATAVVAGGVATATAPLEYNLGLLLGVLGGLAVGVFLNR